MLLTSTSRCSRATRVMSTRRAMEEPRWQSHESLRRANRQFHACKATCDRPCFPYLTIRNSGRESASPITSLKCLVDQHSSDASSPRLVPCCSASPSASRSSEGTSPRYVAIGSSRRNSAMSCSRWYARRTETSDTTRSSPMRRIRDSTDTPHEILSSRARPYESSVAAAARSALGVSAAQLRIRRLPVLAAGPLGVGWDGAASGLVRART